MNTMTLKMPGLCACLLMAGSVSLAARPTLTISDTIGHEWVNEPIVWELPGAQGGTVQLQRDGHLIPAQVVRADGGVRVLFVIDRLAQDATTTVMADMRRQGTASWTTIAIFPCCIRMGFAGRSCCMG